MADTQSLQAKAHYLQTKKSNGGLTAAEEQELQEALQRLAMAKLGL